MYNYFIFFVFGFLFFFTGPTDIDSKNYFDLVGLQDVSMYGRKGVDNGLCGMGRPCKQFKHKVESCNQ